MAAVAARGRQPQRRGAAATTPARSCTLYRRLLALRRATPALHRGSQELLAPVDDVVAWRRWVDDSEVLVAVNFATEPRAFTPPAGAWRVALASDSPAAGTPYDGALAPEQAVVLTPA